MNDLIRSLVEAYGPSGFEDGVRDLIRPLIEPHADEVTVDALGNLIARKRATTGEANPLKVMIAAHMDEIGIMASHITEKGFLRFTNIGGVGSHTLLGGRVRFADGTLGIIGVDRMEDRNSTRSTSILSTWALPAARIARCAWATRPTLCGRSRRAAAI